MKQISSGGIEITDYCNLNCLHCYLGLSQRHKQHMDFARILFIIDEYIKRKAGHITITGGEPFVHPKIHDLIVIIGNNYRDTPFILTTNGTLLTQDAIGLIEKAPNVTIQISLDGACAETHNRQHGKDTFEKLLNIIKKMEVIPKERKVLRMTISKINYLEVIQVIKIAQEHSFRTSLTYTCKVGNALKNWDQLEMSLSQKMLVHELVLEYAEHFPDYGIKPPQSILSCPFENPEFPFGLDICTNGDASICTCLGNEFIIGNVFEDSFDNVLLSPKINDLNKRIMERKTFLQKHDCANCIVSDKCGQGCIGRALQLGDELGLDGECSYRCAQLLKNFFFLARKNQLI